MSSSENTNMQFWNLKNHYILNISNQKRVKNLKNHIPGFTIVMAVIIIIKKEHLAQHPIFHIAL